MEKKMMYYGITLLFVLDTVIYILSSIFEVVIVAIAQNNWFVYVCITIVYLIIMYLILLWVKRIPVIKLWFFVLLICLRAIPVREIFSSQYESLIEKNITNLILFNGTVSGAFIVIFSVIMFFKYYRFRDQ